MHLESPAHTDRQCQCTEVAHNVENCLSVVVCFLVDASGRYCDVPASGNRLATYSCDKHANTAIGDIECDYEPCNISEYFLRIKSKIHQYNRNLDKACPHEIHVLGPEVDLAEIQSRV